MATALTPQTDITSGKVMWLTKNLRLVSASLQKIKSIKNPIKFVFCFFWYSIKSESSDSFVSHFDGHFAYLKTLDFYFKQAKNPEMWQFWTSKFIISVGGCMVLFP